jgi:beta-xylosidase
MKRIFFLFVFTIVNINIYSQSDKLPDAKPKSGNPIIKGWYADPEAAVFGNKYWIYPTYSDDFGKADSSKGFSKQQLEARKKTINKQYLKQTFINAFSSPDLVKWEKHPHVLDVKNIKWAAYSLWAPSIIEANKKYYLFFSANDIQNNEQLGGIGVAVSKSPSGPFIDGIGKPLIDKFHNGAQPIDQFVFRDSDGTHYLYYGGWSHCNVVKLNADLLSLKPFDDGVTFKEITPQNYVEGVFVFKRNNKYYLMWSEGSWGGSDYSVAYAIGNSPIGPFKRIDKILKQDSLIANGAGHHSIINLPGTDEYYIIYHRRPLKTSNPNHREICIDKLYFDEQGNIKPVIMTVEGVDIQRILNQ